MKNKRIKICYINGTHWDREWYESFQEYRAWLVQTMDEALAALEKHPDLHCFHLDGQTILLEDYLEIRPENRERLLKQLRSGRMFAGPWYCLPDEFLISGEAFIRNFTCGLRILRDMKVEPMSDGYCPDMFGHIASLPMILAGFGFRHAVLWRGVAETEVGSHFVWKGPDNSEVLVTKLPDKSGYGWFHVVVRSLYEDGKTEEAVKAFCDFVSDQKQHLRLPFLYCSDALDHKPIFSDAPRFLARLAESVPDADIVRTTIPDYVRDVIKAAKQTRLTVRRGELRDPSERFGSNNWLIPHCLSSRYPLKRENDLCQNGLELVAEPAAAFALLSGHLVPPGYLNLAWRYLMRNHPHDSICGCSIDAVHADMPYRFRQCSNIADTVFRQAVSTFACPTAGLKDGWKTIAVHNPLPWARKEIIELDVLLPPDMLPYEQHLIMSGVVRRQFQLLLDKKAVDYQVLSLSVGRTAKQINKKGRQQLAGACEICRVAVKMSLPPASCSVLRVEPLVDKHHRDDGTLRIAPLSAQNRRIAIEVGPAGTVALKQIKTGRIFDNLFLYEDQGDAGDGWVYVPPVNDRKIISPGLSTVSVEQNGPLCVVFRIDRKLEVPARQGANPGESRSADQVSLAITDRLILMADAPYLRVRTTVTNTACDHRLRVLFPSGVKADEYWADEPFVFLKRPVAIRKETLSGKEVDPVERPHHSMFGIEDTRGGLAVLTPYGLHEHSVMEDSCRTLALTLFRGFSRTVSTDGEPGGQIRGPLEFEYLLYPYAGRFDRVSALRMLAGVRAGAPAHIADSGVKSTSFISVEGNVHVTALKPALDEKGIVVRLWNPGPKAASAGIRFIKPVKAAWLADLNEEKISEIFPRGNSVALIVPPFALKTVMTVFN